MRKPKVVSLFSGAGGLDIGFKKAGFHTVFATDVWDIACNTLKANNMADEVICNDVRKINFDEVVNKYGEIKCCIDEVEMLQNKYKIGNIRQRKEGLALRIVGDELPEEAVITDSDIDLEDVYLYYFE